jgi:chromate reductase
MQVPLSILLKKTIMKKIIAFGGSSSKKSINKRFATYTAHLFQNATIEILDLNDYEMPVFSVDKQEENGIHPLAEKFYAKLGEADLIVVSLAEHNGAYSTAFKNILDWTSRFKNNVFQQKSMLLLTTSPGARGGGFVMEIAKSRFPKHEAILVGTFSLPSFEENFNQESGITNETLKNQLLEIVNTIQI